MFIEKIHQNEKVVHDFTGKLYEIIEPWHVISINVVCVTSKGSDQPAHTGSLIRAFASRLNILWLLSYWPNIIWTFYAQKEGAQACLSLHLSKCHIVGHHMPLLIFEKGMFFYR